MNILKDIRITLLLLIFSLLPLFETNGQVITGRFTTYMYNWQVQNQQYGSSKHLRLYQGLVMNVKNIGSSKFSLHSSIRYTKDFISDDSFNINWRFQYLYGKLKNIFNVFDLKLGRQYIYSGVGYGSIDGFNGKLKLKNIADIQIYAGMPVSWYYDLKVQKWDENRMYGFRIQPRMFLRTLVGISYVQKHMKPLPYKVPGKFTFKEWNITSEAMELAGLDFYTEWSRKVNSYGRIDWDMTYKDIYRGNFYFNVPLSEKLTLSAEYYYRKPRIYNNSIFSVFTQHDNSEYWLRIYYNIKKNLTISGGTSIVSYSGEKGYRNNINLNYTYFNIGFTRTSGYSGRLDGITGSINYPVRNNIWIKGGSNITRYKLFESLEDYENLLSTFAGISYMPKKTCTFDIEGQGLNNYNYNRDLRLLFRANYWFSFRKKSQ